MIQTEKIELDLFEWDVHFASNIPGPGITSHPDEMKERPSSIVKETESEELKKKIEMDFKCVEC